MQYATAKNSPMATPNAIMPTPMPRLPCTARLNSSGPSAGRPPGRGGQRRLGLGPAILVVDPCLDQRLGEDPREHERDQPAGEPAPAARRTSALTMSCLPTTRLGRRNLRLIA